MKWVLLAFGVALMADCLTWSLLETFVRRPELLADLASRKRSSDRKFLLKMAMFAVGACLIVWGAA